MSSDRVGPSVPADSSGEAAPGPSDAHPDEAGLLPSDPGPGAAAPVPSDPGPLDAATASEWQEVRDLARLLDASLRIPGTNWRFGIDALLGLVPGIGDAAGLVAAAMVIGQSVRLGARGWTVARMLLLAVIDAVVGAVPVLGTVFDVGFKANLRNVRLLEQHLADPQAARTRSRRQVVATVTGVTVATIVLAVLLVAGLVAVLSWLF